MRRAGGRRGKREASGQRPELQRGLPLRPPGAGGPCARAVDRPKGRGQQKDGSSGEVCFGPRRNKGQRDAPGLCPGPRPTPPPWLTFLCELHPQRRRTGYLADSPFAADASIFAKASAASFLISSESLLSNSSNAGVTPPRLGLIFFSQSRKSPVNPGILRRHSRKRLARNGTVVEAY